MRLYYSVLAFVLSACAGSTSLSTAPDSSAGAVGVTTPSQASIGGDVAAATSVAQAWLALVDQGKYGESWDAAAPVFQQAVSRDNWATQVGSGRAPLGKLGSRKLLSAAYTTSLPGVGTGQYVVIRYAAAYENMPQAVETITPMMTADGTWHVAGYYIK